MLKWNRDSLPSGSSGWLNGEHSVLAAPPPPPGTNLSFVLVFTSFSTSWREIGTKNLFSMTKLYNSLQTRNSCQLEKEIKAHTIGLKK